MAKQIFTNLPVRDVAKATAFYTVLAAEKNPPAIQPSSA